MSEQRYHYAIHAKVVDGEFQGWFIDWDHSESAFGIANMWDSNCNSWHEPNCRIDNNLLVNLSQVLEQTRTAESAPTITVQESNLPPW